MKKQGFPLKYFVETLKRKEEEAPVTENIYPTYYELGKSAPLLARKDIVRAYEERGISLR